MKIVDCSLRQHGRAMLEIINEAIQNTTWVYDYLPRSDAQLYSYVNERQSKGFPVIVAVGDAGRLLGFGTFGEFRGLPGYKYTVEHSVFVDKDVRRQGTGRVILQRLLDLASAMQMHVVIGAIDSSNLPSIALHESLGFQLCGTLREVGFKRDSWLDVLMYQLTLATPLEPRDG